MKLLAAAGNGTSAAFPIPSGLARNISHTYTLYVFGTFGGSTVGLEISPDNVNWFGTGVAITAASAQNLEFRAIAVRATVGGGAGNSITAILL